MNLLPIVYGTMLLSAPSAALAADLRIGIVGLDTSHAPTFIKLINGPAPGGIENVRVVAVYKGGSPDLSISISRVETFAAQIAQDPAVVFYDSVAELAAAVDAVMILTVDGRLHLEQARAVIAARKPVFIDKPLAASLQDAVEIMRLAQESGVPCFSSSTLRYAPEVIAAHTADLGEVRSAFAYTPATLAPHHPDLFWYGIHGVETLYTLLGPGCESVTRTHTEDNDVVTGRWSDGRVGILYGGRNAKIGHGFALFAEKGARSSTARPDSAALVRDVIAFFHSGVAPVPAEETLEILAFMEAADESKRRGGIPVELAAVRLKATPPTDAGR